MVRPARQAIQWRVMEIVTLRRADVTDPLLAELGGFIAGRNAHRAQHIGYLGDTPADVTAELKELDGDFTFAVARGPGGEVTGTLGMEWDPEVGRAWVLGPWAGTPELMDELYATVDATVPAGIGEREIFCDVTNAAVCAFAERHRYGEPKSHAILTFKRADLAGLAPVTLPTLTPPFEGQFAALHDRAFPGTHTPAPALLASGQPIWVELSGTQLLGYVTLKLRPEHDDAQIDYVAVHEDARGKGVGGRLVAAALHLAFADERITHMDLVTDNPVARRLYERVGFTLVQDMYSYRRDVSG
jgi:ribosomal protein S18 acetylase RimI-like enzyme